MSLSLSKRKDYLFGPGGMDFGLDQTRLPFFTTVLTAPLVSGMWRLTPPHPW
jgi:hypothetical protein